MGVRHKEPAHPDAAVRNFRIVPRRLGITLDRNGYLTISLDDVSVAGTERHRRPVAPTESTGQRGANRIGIG